MAHFVQLGNVVVWRHIRKTQCEHTAGSHDMRQFSLVHAEFYTSVCFIWPNIFAVHIHAMCAASFCWGCCLICFWNPREICVVTPFSFPLFYLISHTSELPQHWSRAPSFSCSPTALIHDLPLAIPRVLSLLAVAGDAERWTDGAVIESVDGGSWTARWACSHLGERTENADCGKHIHTVHEVYSSTWEDSLLQNIALVLT